MLDGLYALALTEVSECRHVCVCVRCVYLENENFCLRLTVTLQTKHSLPLTRSFVSDVVIVFFHHCGEFFRIIFLFAVFLRFVQGISTTETPFHFKVSSWHMRSQAMKHRNNIINNNNNSNTPSTPLQALRLGRSGRMFGHVTRATQLCWHWLL